MDEQERLERRKALASGMIWEAYKMGLNVDDLPEVARLAKELDDLLKQEQARIARERKRAHLRSL